MAIKVGDIFQRNDYKKDCDVPNYFIIVIGVGPHYLEGRRSEFRSLVHESITWGIREIPFYFNKVNDD